MDAVAPFFDGHRELRAVVEAVLEGRQGVVTRDGAAARLTIGCYEIFGGDAASEGAARLIASSARPRELVYGNDPAWRGRILDVFGSQVFDRPMRDYDASGLDVGALRAVEQGVPSGYEVRALDVALASQLDAELEPHGMQTFASPADLVAAGPNVAVMHEGRLACAATAYTGSSRLVEVAIATRVAHRGRGLAAVAAASFLRRCLEEGRVPCWSASNPVSQRLAVRLGYRPVGVCEVLYLR